MEKTKSTLKIGKFATSESTEKEESTAPDSPCERSAEMVGMVRIAWK